MDKIVSFEVIFPVLYNITPLNVAFRRSLIGVNLQAWHEVIATVADAQLTNHRDHFVWSLH